MCSRIHPVVKWGCIAPICIVLALVAGVWLIDAFMPSAMMRTLPDSATDVKEYRSGLFDTLYLMKARIPESEYPVVAARLGLRKRFDEQAQKDKYIKSMVNMQFGEAPAWWDPPQATQSTYFRYTKGEESLGVLHYADEHVYYASTVW